MVNFMLRWKTYWLAGAVVFISLLAAIFLPVPEIFRGLWSTPGVIGLIAIVYQIWRDRQTHERALERQERQQDFTLGIASHMANITFDKHVSFCEAYMKAMNEGLIELFQTGPDPKALDIASNLTRIRAEYTAWLSPEIEAKLLPLERALRRVGAGANLEKHLRSEEGRYKVIKEIFDSLGIIHGLKEVETEDQRQIVASEVFERLRELLGIRDLTTIRQKALQSAMGRLRNS